MRAPARTSAVLPALASLCLALAAAACSSRANEGAISVAVIGEESGPFESGARLSYAGQLVREATAEGLVAMDAQGEVVPAIAESWIVTDDGSSYFFRIRNSSWPDGEQLDAPSVRAAFQRTIRAYRGTTLGLDLGIIDDVRVMADRVIEIRLKSPMPEFLQLLAQPELGLRKGASGTGPMVRAEADSGSEAGDPAGADEILRLQPVPPQLRGLPQVRGWDDNVLDVIVRGLPAAQAVEAFRNDELELVLNGTLATLPLADVGPLSSGTLRLDPGVGLFGIAFRNDDGLLAAPERREALAMAIDRARLVEQFNVAGWTPTTRLVPPTLPGEREERWAGQSLEQRRAVARARIAAWDGGDEGPARLTIAMPDGPGSELLLARLAADFAAIGVQLERAEEGEKADLALIDRLARYAGPRWFLNQFNCDIVRPLCSPDADVLVDRSLYSLAPAEAAGLLTEAEEQVTRAEVFIPLGTPLRWSLIRGGVGGFAENRWGRHPLFPLSVAPIS